MAATAAPLSMSPSATGGADLGDSNISSPLSEVDDKDTNDEEMNIHLDNEGDDKTSTLSTFDHPEGQSPESDSDSALSDAQSVANSDANDTEAETERLYDTPRHQRQRDVVVDQFNEGQVFEHTPTKLRRAAAAGNDEDVPEDESLSEDAVSNPPTGSDVDESPVKVATTKDTSADDEPQLDSQDRKRKRSTADTPEAGQPSSKRTGSVGVADAEVEHDVAMDDEEIASGNPQSVYQSPVNGQAASPEKQDVPVEEVERDTEHRVSRKMTRNGLKIRNAAAGEPVESVIDHLAPNDGANVDGEEEVESIDRAADVEAEEEAEAEAAARNAEELERKQAAFKDWSKIEEMFGMFRDRLYKDRLQRLEEEEQSLLADEPTHPEYLNMKQCLDDRLARKLARIDKEHELRMQANERRAVAIRSQIWSQFYQSVREKREAVLEALNKEWYDVQMARRSAHSVHDCGILFPKDPAQRVRNSVAYNTEVSTLAGLAKYEGFPAGPEMRGVTESELADDLSLIERNRRSRQRQAFQQPREGYYQTPTFNRLGPAGEQFLKETPWANPNHSAHRAAYQQTPVQVDGRAEAGSATGRTAPQIPTPSSSATIEAPLSTQRSPALSNRASESPELARSVFKAVPPAKKTSHAPALNRGAKAAAV